MATSLKYNLPTLPTAHGCGAPSQTMKEGTQSQFQRLEERKEPSAPPSFLDEDYFGMFEIQILVVDWAPFFMALPTCLHLRLITQGEGEGEGEGAIWAQGARHLI